MAAGESWLDLHQQFRQFQDRYTQDAREEARLLDTLHEADVSYHHQICQARSFFGWLHFLRTNDMSGITRNEWDDKAELTRDGLPLAYEHEEKGVISLDGFRKFATALRSNAQLAAQLVRFVSPRVMSKKLKAVLGVDIKTEQAVVLEALCFSLHGSVFQRADFERFRELLRVVLKDEFHSFQNPLEAFGFQVSSAVDAAHNLTHPPAHKPSHASINLLKSQPHHSRWCVIEPVSEGDSVGESVALKMAALAVIRSSREVLRRSFRSALLFVAFQSEGLATFDTSASVALEDKRKREKLLDEQTEQEQPDGVETNSLFSRVRSLSHTFLQSATQEEKTKCNVPTRPGPRVLKAGSVIMPQQRGKKLFSTLAPVKEEGKRSAQTAVGSGTAVVKRMLETRRWRLEESVRRLLFGAERTMNQWPSRGLTVLGEVLKMTNEVFPAVYEKFRLQITALFLFELFLIPAFERPEVSGALSGFDIGANMKRNIRFAVKLLRKVIYGGSLPTTGFSQKLNVFLEEQQVRFREKISELCRRAEICAEGKCEESTNLLLQPSTMCMSLGELCDLQRILFRNKAVLSREPALHPLLPFASLPTKGLPNDLCTQRYVLPIGSPAERTHLLPKLTPLHSHVQAFRLSLTSRSTLRELSKSPEAAKKAEEALLRLIRLLTEFFLRLGTHALEECPKENTNDVAELLRFSRDRLSAVLEITSSWDNIAQQLCLADLSLDALETALPFLPPLFLKHNFRLIRLELGRVLRVLEERRLVLFKPRQKELEEALSEAKNELATLHEECGAMNAILFDRKVLSFARSVSIPFRQLLPSSLQRTPALSLLALSAGLFEGPEPISLASLESLGAESTEPPAAHAARAGPIFFCKNVDTFVSECAEFWRDFRKHEVLTSRIFHRFLAVCREKVDHDATFTSNEVEPAVELLEKLLSSRLYPLFYPANLQSVSNADRAFQQLTDSLAWVKPQQLDLHEKVPTKPRFWARALAALAELNDHIACRSPAEKLAAVTRCVKWVVRTLQVHTGNAGTDADTTLSALIFLVVLAKPPRLPSALHFIETFRRSSRLEGEEGYCLTQLSLAVRFIQETLAHIPEKMARSSVSLTSTASKLASDSRLSISRHPRSTHTLSLLLHNHALVAHIVVFLSTQERARAACVGRKWTVFQLAHAHPWRWAVIAKEAAQMATAFRGSSSCKSLARVTRFGHNLLSSDVFALDVIRFAFRVGWEREVLFFADLARFRSLGGQSERKLAAAAVTLWSQYVNPLSPLRVTSFPPATVATIAQRVSVLRAQFKLEKDVDVLAELWGKKARTRLASSAASKQRLASGSYVTAPALEQSPERKSPPPRVTGDFLKIRVFLPAVSLSQLLSGSTHTQPAFTEAEDQLAPGYVTLACARDADSDWVKSKALDSFVKRAARRGAWSEEERQLQKPFVLALWSWFALFRSKQTLQGDSPQTRKALLEGHSLTDLFAPEELVPVSLNPDYILKLDLRVNRTRVATANRCLFHPLPVPKLFSPDDVLTLPSSEEKERRDGEPLSTVGVFRSAERVVSVLLQLIFLPAYAATAERRTTAL